MIKKKRRPMFNEYQQEIIAIVAILFILGLYFMLKRSSIQKNPIDQSKNDTPKAAIHEEIKETPKIEEKPNLILDFYSDEKETDIKEITPTAEVVSTDLTNRRKSDKTIQKREVPERGKITKQCFCEFSGERILVAEDNIINQKVIIGLLAGSGIELVIANDGQEVLDILEKETDFLMILMDAHMPRVDGFEATRIIRTNPKYDHILVVALSGDTATDDIQKMKDAGMSEQLEKPLRMESLYKIFYAYTGQKTHEEDEDENAFVEVLMTKDLNGEIGLQTCGGDEDFYREILSEFILNYSNSSDKLGEFLRSNDLLNADKLLLDIIGISSNIGANPLSEIASNLKLALGDTQEKSYFSLLDQYKVHLDRVVQDIKDYL